jgi:hypothetical protein
VGGRLPAANAKAPWSPWPLRDRTSIAGIGEYRYWRGGRRRPQRVRGSRARR